MERGYAGKSETAGTSEAISCINHDLLHCLPIVLPMFCQHLLTFPSEVPGFSQALPTKCQLPLRLLTCCNSTVVAERIRRHSLQTHLSQKAQGHPPLSGLLTRSASAVVANHVWENFGSRAP